MKTRIICFGNDIMRDDGAALHVARALSARLEQEGIEADVVESAVAGYELIDLLRGCDRVILVESIQQEGRLPGEVIRIDGSDTQLRLCSLREANLPVVLEAGTKLGFDMPDEITVYGIQGEDLLTFGQELTSAVAAAVPRAVDQILAELSPG